MRNIQAAGMLAVVLSALVQPVLGEDIAWQQTFDYPKGKGLPAGQTLDILGIAPGDNYETAKARLEQLRGEVSGAPALKEIVTQYGLQTPGGGVITAEFVGEIFMERDLPGTTRSKERITVRLTAPSSGHQVIAIERQLSYNDQSEQIRKSQLLDAVVQRMGGAPDEADSGSRVPYHRYQFDDGQRVAAEAHRDCYDYSKTWSDQGSLYIINESGTCDVVYDVLIAPGLSDDHAKAVIFYLYDNDRAKANLTADYAFFETYIQQIQSGAGSAPPTL